MGISRCGALEVLKAWCEVRMEDLQNLEMCPKSGGVPAVLGGAMISMGGLLERLDLKH